MSCPAWRAGRLPLLLAIVLLASCDKIVSVCHACLSSEPNSVVAAKDVSKINFLNGKGGLPSSARQIYYHEECGADCTFWVRFETSEADARKLAKALFPTALAPGNNPLRDSNSELFRDAGYPWWPAGFPDGFEGVSADGNGIPAKAMIVAPLGTGVRVWITVAEM